jgi:hypothetical protein
MIHAIFFAAALISTVRDRRSVNVTVYNSELALVHDRRRVSLPAGVNTLAWRDVSAQMDPASALLESLTAGNPVDVLEQNFDFDVMNPESILNKYVGHEVTVVHPAQFAGQRDVRERARILSTGGGIVLQYRDRVETSLRGGYIMYPGVPKSLRDHPTLDLQLDSRGGEQILDLSYMTQGLSWSANYVGTVSADDTRLSLTGLITLSNTSGVDYDNARLQLVAGDVNAPPPAPRMLKTIATVRSSDQYSVQQENFFEYHLYTMPRPTTILQNQTKQLTLLSARDIPLHKTLELRGSSGYYENAEPDLGDRLPIGVYATFENKGGELGIPLPAGTVRLYKSDSHGLSQFLGGEGIAHTPRNETVRMHLGNSFDVTARKRQTEFVIGNGSCSSSSSYEVVISNAKDAAQDVLVVEQLPGDWRITAENLPHTKTSASTANWNVSVPAGGRATLTYTAFTKWC